MLVLVCVRVDHCTRNFMMHPVCVVLSRRNSDSALQVTEGQTLGLKLPIEKT